MNLEPLFAFEISASRKIDPSKYPDVKPWVPKAIAEEDQRPKMQLWKNEPTEDGQMVARRRRIKFLRKYENDSPLIKATADCLEACFQRNRCCSGTCPECGWLLQRWFVRKSKPFISDAIEKDGQKLFAITIIPAQPIIQPGQLSSFSTVNVQRRLKTALDKVGLGDAIGGVGISFNEDRDGKYEPLWCVHIYIITSIANKKRVQHLLKEIYIADDRIPRPVKISDSTIALTEDHMHSKSCSRVGLAMTQSKKEMALPGNVERHREINCGSKKGWNYLSIWTNAFLLTDLYFVVQSRLLRRPK